MSNGSTFTLPRWAVARSMKPIRSSALNSDLLLRTEALTTATITSSNIPEAREMMSTWPLRHRVVGAGADGDAGIRGHRCG